MFKNADVDLSDDNTKLKVVTEEGYTFKITKDKVEYVGNNVEIEEPDLQEGEIIFSYNPSTPTQGSVEVIIGTKTELGNNWIEYSTDGNSWSKYESPITVTDNCKIYARLRNNIGPSADTATGNVENIDRLDPKIFTPTTTNTTNSITLTGSTEDAEATETDGCSGIDVYYFSIDGGEWLPENGQVETSYTFNGLVQGKEYELKMKAVDKAGNETETEEIKCTTVSVPGLVEGTNVTFSYSPQTMTNGNVTVTIATQGVSGYTLQYSKDGSSWQNYSSPITMETNGTVYAKLVDSSGQEGGSASANITIIDKLKPNEPTLQVTGVTSSSITVTANATDQAQTNEYASSGIKGYQFSINNGAWEPQAPQTSGTYTFSNLTANTPYTLKVKAIDNANNETEIVNTISQTTKSKTAEEALVPNPSGATAETKSPYVKYNNQTWRVLYNDSTHGLQLISADNVTTVTLGSRESVSQAESSYNLALYTLRTNANNYKGTIATDARCVGSIAKLSSGKFDLTDDAEYITGNAGRVRDGDNYYVDDSKQIKNLGINATSYTWLASRISYIIKPSAKNFGVRAIDSNGNLLSIDSVYFSRSYNNTSNKYCSSCTFGFRPVILMPSDTIISSGRGSSSDPYIIK